MEAGAETQQSLSFYSILFHLIPFKDMREINEIIIHCTATPEGREVSADEIRKWHKARGFKDIGYHYVIHLDGRVENGRNIETVGAHCEGHNANSIGVVYVGGLAKDGKTPKDTRTAKQKAALKWLVGGLVVHFGASVHGHNEYSDKACPCFDVGSET